MEITVLTAFVEVADCGSFSAAAERLFLTQPAVSKRISGLEEELGTPLFDRAGRRIRLTEAGRALLPRARALVNETGDIKRLIAGLSGQVRGALSMGTSHHVGLHRLPEVLRDYTKSYPDVQLDIRFMDSETACREIALGKLELSLVTLPSSADGLHLETLWVDRLHFVVCPDHPLVSHADLQLAELAFYPAVLPSPSTFTRTILDTAVQETRLPLKVAMSTNYLETLRMLASIGLGWTLLPETMLGPDLVPLNVKGIPLTRNLGAVTRAEGILSNAAKAMIRACRATRQASDSARSSVRAPGDPAPAKAQGRKGRD